MLKRYSEILRTGNGNEELAGLQRRYIEKYL
jgi:hypothetical protein